MSDRPASRNQAATDGVADSVDTAEVARFSELASQWWDPTGPFAPLHRLNPARLSWIRNSLVTHFGREHTALRPFEGLSILDIGCGGGLLCEPLRRMGANVIGADASAENIAAARVHAARMGLDIDYRASTAEALVDAGERFDALINMEVVEHVADVSAFLGACRRLLKPRGAMVLSTLNRTAKSFLLGIVAAEYVLGWIPRGTHDWRRFLTLEEMEAALGDAGFETVDFAGLRYRLATGDWGVADDTSVNYMALAVPA